MGGSYSWRFLLLTRRSSLLSLPLSSWLGITVSLEYKLVLSPNSTTRGRIKGVHGIVLRKMKEKTKKVEKSSLALLACLACTSLRGGGS
mmetsp:Transcript_38741/g.83105  ORF Transcript_38741/g.83105 Transcript_38741/m.83105 type:complete len:89 (-) Transcript_38741:172-438(-)